MKQLFLVPFFLFCFTLLGFAQKKQSELNEMINLDRYEQDNIEVVYKSENKKRVVFIGNSITDSWPNNSPQFFEDNNFVGRGISGQTSPQLLLRFQQDVIKLSPKVVVINIGTNDIALNTGPYNPDFTLDNIKSMAQLAKANNIKVILTSVLPVGHYPWRKEVKDVPTLIDALNAKIQLFAKTSGFIYVDYNSAMRDADGGMKPELAEDGVHPNQRGYEVMEQLVLPIIKKAVK